MNTSPQPKHSRRIILTLLTGALFGPLFLLVGTRAANLHTVARPLSAYAPYDPATYGIPYEIGGYNILAVKTSSNTACMRTGRMRITVQTSQPGLESLLTSKREVVRQTLRQLPSLADIDFDLEFISLEPWNPEGFMASNADWNEARKNGCFSSGPALIASPTPVPYGNSSP